MISCFRFLVIFMTFFLLINGSLTWCKTIYPEVMFILDGSGSMWKKSGNQIKIEAAKQVLHKIVPSLPPEVTVGLTVYGHNRKNDCSDIEILIPPGSHDRQGLLSKVDSISPKGMTPMAASITKVAQLLQDKEGETTIVLVSDGKETCNNDPCKAVKNLKSSGIKFVLHVVGFDVTPQEKAQLECMAQAGGGRYFSAGSTSDLLSALETVKQEVVQKVKETKTVTKKASNSIIGKLHVTIPSEGRGQIKEIVIKKGDNGSVINRIKNPSEEGNYPLLKGSYQVWVAYDNGIYQPVRVAVATIEIKGGETTDLTFGVIIPRLADQLEKIPVDYISIEGQKGSNFKFNISYRPLMFTPKVVPSGSYTFSIHYGSLAFGPIFKKPIVVARDIMVDSGKSVQVPITCGFKLKKTTSELTGWELKLHNKKEKFFSVLVGIGGIHANDLWLPYALSPGIYDLNIYVKGMAQPMPLVQGLELKEGQVLEFDTGL